MRFLLDQTVRAVLLLMLVVPTGVVAAAAPVLAAGPERTARCAGFEIVAHRGLHPSRIDENSRRALRRAAELGLSVEFDVWSDADGRLWVFHDRDTQRATGESHLIDDLSTAQVRDLRYTKAGSRVAPFAAAIRIIVAHPGTPAYIEPKQAAIADDVARAVVRAERVKATWVTAYGDVVHDRWPRVSLLEKSGTQRPAPADLVDRGVDVVSLYAGQITTAAIRGYHAAGIAVEGRFSDETAAWDRALDAGADGQVTDRPRALGDYCSTR